MPYKERVNLNAKDSREGRGTYYNYTNVITKQCRNCVTVKRETVKQEEGCELSVESRKVDAVSLQIQKFFKLVVTDRCSLMTCCNDDLLNTLQSAERHVYFSARRSKEIRGIKVNCARFIIVNLSS